MPKSLRVFAIVSYEAVMYCLFLLPRYAIFNFFKASLLRMVGAKIGRRVTIYPGVWIVPGRNLTVGDDVDFAMGVLVTTAGGVSIGDRVLIGYRTQIISANHVVPPGREPIFGSGHEKKPVNIKRDAWIGGNCTILPGVSIGEGAVVGAGSVVTKDIPDFEIWAGVPARKLKTRV